MVLHVMAECFTIVTLVISFVLLMLAVKNLSVGTAYAVWTGIGILGTTILGMALLGEPRNAAGFSLCGIDFCGIIGLKTMSGEQN